VSASATVVGRERLRLFLAFRLPDDALGTLVRWQQIGLAPPDRARVVPRDNLHVTIAFLGSRPAAELDLLTEGLREAVADVAPPVLTPARYRETRSVGMLVCDDEDGRATRIAGALHARLERLGVYEREQRPWLPHLTVLRFRERPRLDPPLPDLGPVTMSDSAVMHSVLRPTGAQYEVLQSVPLGGG
jgi:RNA 2',3'-cyclic 3'-phosphodiesterase